MFKVKKIANWICRKLTKKQVESIIKFLSDLLEDPQTKFKDSKSDNPNYRKFDVDPEPPKDYTEPDNVKNYKDILKTKKIKAIKHRGQNEPKEHISCPHCYAPHQYIYINNGKKKSIQYKCKVCSKTFTETPKTKSPKFICPICGRALFLWKQRAFVDIYKCQNRKCERYIENLNKLSKEERKMQKEKPSNFKLHYIYRDYKINFKNVITEELIKPVKRLSQFTYKPSVIGLVLTFHITLHQSTRQTAFALKNIFGIPISHSTVARMAKVASSVCHQFNIRNTPKVQGKQAADETYIKVNGKHHYVWIAISYFRSIITAYYVSDSRGEETAIKTLSMANERYEPQDEESLTIAVDGNPSYLAAATYLIKNGIKISLKKVIGLQNKDDESAEFRYLKNMVERVNRTYKLYAKNSFKNVEGASSNLALAVTDYNFIRPHSSLQYKPPIINKDLTDLHFIQDKWTKIITTTF